jgi:ribosomal protein L40E
MKRCTYCGRENGDAATTCSGCGEPLAKPEPPAPEVVDPSLAPVIVASFHNAEEAELLKAQLESVGIEAFVPEEYTTGVFSAVIPFQNVTVQVHARDAEAARAIVAAFTPASSPPTPPTEDSPTERPTTNDQEPPQTEPPISREAPGMTRCVSCGALIPWDSILCPKCGWTQPRLA